MPTDDYDIEAFEEALRLFRRLPAAARVKLLRALAVVFDFDHNHASDNSSNESQRSLFSTSTPEHSTSVPFSVSKGMSPKEFIYEKQPKTDVERVACLGFYLTHYLDLPHFKTSDISRLNTEAAQAKFSNAAYTINYAMKAGYLAPGPKGTRQLSAAGERFVQGLPDREKARSQMAQAQSRRQRSRAKKHLDR